jgi:hypothetical protein
MALAGLLSSILSQTVHIVEKRQGARGEWTGLCKSGAYSTNKLFSTLLCTIQSIRNLYLDEKYGIIRRLPRPDVHLINNHGYTRRSDKSLLNYSRRHRHLTSNRGTQTNLNAEPEQLNWKYSLMSFQKQGTSSKTRHIFNSQQKAYGQIPSLSEHLNDKFLLQHYKRFIHIWIFLSATNLECNNQQKTLPLKTKADYYIARCSL